MKRTEGLRKRPRIHRSPPIYSFSLPLIASGLALLQVCTRTEALNRSARLQASQNLPSLSRSSPRAPVASSGCGTTMRKRVVPDFRRPPQGCLPLRCPRPSFVAFAFETCASRCLSRSNSLHGPDCRVQTRCPCCPG